MNDFNRGALPDPCLRLDYGFGEQWASVELGDGTGYVRLADYERTLGENAKLRKYAKLLAVNLEASGCDYCPYAEDHETCDLGAMPNGECKPYRELRECGIEVENA